MLEGTKIRLRTVEPEDLTCLLIWENSPFNWKYSDTELPFSAFEMKQFIENQQNFRSTNQLRFMICRLGDDLPIGTLDLYDINFKHGRAGVGVLVADEENRNQGYALEALSILDDYAMNVLNLSVLYASIHADNPNSIGLFKRANYEHVGTRKDWFKLGNKRINEEIYSKCLND